MSFNRPKRTISKAYEWVWDNVEPIKSVLLTFLILFSIFLTWQLWTYTPKLEVLDPTDPIVANIEQGNKMPVEDVIEPSKVILHHNGKHYWIPTLSSEKDNVYERLQNDVLLVKENSNPGAKFDENDKIFDIVYPTPIPIQVLQEIFKFSGENPFSSDLGTVKGLEVFYDRDEWIVRFLPSEDDDQVYNFQITEARDFSNVVDKYLKDDDLEQVERFVLDDEKFYLPKEDITIEGYLYQVGDEIKIDDYLKFLLPGDRVKVDSSRTIYSDGKSIIQYSENLNKFVYKSPTSNTSREDENVVKPPVILKGIDFINNHRGWTNDFHLYGYSHSGGNYEGIPENAEMTFRMIVDGLPIMESPLSNINLEYSNQELYKYERSLLYLTTQVAPYDYKLPSGETVISMLQEIPSTKIKDVMIGYYVDKRNDDEQVEGDVKLLVPTWYYKVGSNWYRIDDLKAPLGNKGR